MKTKKKKKERSLHSESASDFQFLLQNFGILLKKGLQSTKGDILCNFIIRIYSKTLFPDNVKKIPEFSGGYGNSKLDPALNLCFAFIYDKMAGPRI